jgi:hypothetical protein
MTVTVESMLRLIAGALISVSVLLAQFVDARFNWVALFIGLNLAQSFFTGWCPMMTILRKFGVRDSR